MYVYAGSIHLPRVWRWGGRGESKNGSSGLQAGVSFPRKCELSSVIFGRLLCEPGAVPCPGDPWLLKSEVPG